MSKLIERYERYTKWDRFVIYITHWKGKLTTESKVSIIYVFSCWYGCLIVRFAQTFDTINQFSIQKSD